MVALVVPVTTNTKLNLIPSTGLRGNLGSARSLRLPKRMAQSTTKSTVSAKFELKPPPYPLDALEPHMGKDTLEFHWGKHHRTYVDNLNKQIAGNELDGLSLEGIIIATYNKGDLLPPFNNAAQVWNHDFFWESMKPGGGGKPSGELLELIERDFGSFDAFAGEFKIAAATQFGSGWAWLVYQDKKLVVVKSPNAINPLVWNYYPLLTIDIWEHAYYLDFQNRRVDYIALFMEKLVSWDAVSARLEVAKAQAAEKEKEEARKKEEAAKAGDKKDDEVYVDNEN